MSAFPRACVVLLLAACCFGSTSAFAGQRVALVIGNSSYERVSKLENPSNDAELVADTFKTAGFDLVDSHRDLKIVEMRRLLRDFAGLAQDADVAVIYYAGHGIEVDGINYLIPVDAALERDIDVYDETISLERVLVTIGPAKQLQLVILDACRDNPFAEKMKRTLASRTIGRGLARVEPTSPNTLIAYSSKAGTTAFDGDGKNSPFTAALAKYIAKPGLDLRKAFGYVRDDVLKATGNRQEPFVYGSLGGDDVPLVSAKIISNEPQQSPPEATRRDYELALQLATRDGWNAFLSQYPEGFYANLARGQLKKISTEEAGAAAAEKARLAEQERARLAAEGAKDADQEQAARAAKAAEEARLAAEKAKWIEQAKAEAAEQVRLAVEKVAAEKLTAEKADADRKAAEEAAAKKASSEFATKDAAEKQYARSLTDIAKSVQMELRRVGCFTATVNGDWNSVSQHSLAQFNRFAGTNFDVKTASLDVLDSVKMKTGRVCPLLCKHGFRAENDECKKVVCDRGFFINDNNVCERNRAERFVSKPSISHHTQSARRSKCFEFGAQSYCE
jgi:uncharacterized caspase-like protein